MLIGILANTSRPTDQRGHMDDSTPWTSFSPNSERLRRVGEVMDARLGRIEQERHLK
jgi:hypothetical protein